MKKTAYFVFVLGALASLVAMATGEGAEETLETTASVSENFIEVHEQSAGIFAGFSYALGALALIGFWAEHSGRKFAKILAVATLILAIVVVFFGAQAGNTGGEIRHTEIRNESNVPNSEIIRQENHDD